MATKCFTIWLTKRLIPTHRITIWTLYQRFIVITILLKQTLTSTLIITTLLRFITCQASGLIIKSVGLLSTFFLKVTDSSFSLLDYALLLVVSTLSPILLPTGSFLYLNKITINLLNENYRNWTLKKWSCIF